LWNYCAHTAATDACTAVSTAEWHTHAVSVSAQFTNPDVAGTGRDAAGAETLVFSNTSLVEARGFESEQAEIAGATVCGQSANTGEHETPQVGQSQKVEPCPTDKERTQAGQFKAQAGQSKSIAKAQQEHNRSITENPDLAQVIDAWPKLPDAIRAAICALVNAAKGNG